MEWDMSTNFSFISLCISIIVLAILLNRSTLKSCDTPVTHNIKINKDINQNDKKPNQNKIDVVKQEWNKYIYKDKLDPPKIEYHHHYTNQLQPIRTQGVLLPIQQLGMLSCPANSEILPLFGRRLQRNSWQYYTYANQYNKVMLPIEHKTKSCMDVYGCSELYNNDVVLIPQYTKEYKVTLYPIDQLQYNPYVIV